MQLVERRIPFLVRLRMWAFYLEWSEFKDLQVTEAEILRTPGNISAVQFPGAKFSCSDKQSYLVVCYCFSCLYT